MRLALRLQWFLLARGLFAIRHIPRICIAAASGSGGKTLLSLGLARFFSQAGIKVKPFKKGPDYIDAAWLGKAAGRDATNLDPFFLDNAALTQLFMNSYAKSAADIAIIEGNRGLYDGLDQSGSCSTAQVARNLKAPILLCIDCRKVTRTVAAIINGLATFEKDLSFAGVILNRIGSIRHERSLRAAIAANSDLPVLGCLPRSPDAIIPERHMGLAGSPVHAAGLEEKLDKLATLIANNCDTSQILKLARKAEPLAGCCADEPACMCSDLTIGVIRDQALWFYYPENLQALENAGARLRFLSLLEYGNTAQWQGLDGIYIGGGFPEDFCTQISQSPHLSLLKSYADRGMPIYAECGGMIVLAKRFRQDNESYPMAGVFPHDVIWTQRPQGLGYVEAKVSRLNPWYELNADLRGHEFHYSCLDRAGQALTLARGTGTGRDKKGATWDGFCQNRVWASYMHIFAPAVPCWAQTFMRLAREYRQESAANADHLATCDSNTAAGGQNV